MGIEALTEVLISTHAPSKAEPCNPAQLRVHAPAKTPRQGLSRTPLAHAARPGRLALACRSAALQMVVGSARQRKAKGLTFHLFSRCFLAPTRVPVSCCCTVCTRGFSTVTKPSQASDATQPEGMLWPFRTIYVVKISVSLAAGKVLFEVSSVRFVGFSKKNVHYVAWGTGKGTSPTLGVSVPAGRDRPRKYAAHE